MNELCLIGYYFTCRDSGNWKIDWGRAIDILEKSTNVPKSHKTFLPCAIWQDFYGVDYDDLLEVQLDEWMNDCISDYIKMYKTKKFKKSRPPPFNPYDPLF